MKQRIDRSRLWMGLLASGLALASMVPLSMVAAAFSAT